jgi:CRP-like cAMP-binding protein
LEPVSLHVRDVLVEPNEPIEHVYFIEQGIASIVAISAGNQRIEIGIVGREGMVGTSILLATDRSPHLTFVQVAGSALRIKSDVLLELLGTSGTATTLLRRYMHILGIHMAYTILSNGRFTLEQRLARWLLMCRDRLDSDDIPLTHEFLSLMLGVRRPGVTEQLQVLEGERIIKSIRGHVILLDRHRLEQIAADIYGVPEQEYARLIHTNCT